MCIVMMWYTTVEILYLRKINMRAKEMIKKVDNKDVVHACDAERKDEYKDYYIGFKPIDEWYCDNIGMTKGHVVFISDSEEEAEEEMRRLGGNNNYLWGTTLRYSQGAKAGQGWDSEMMMSVNAVNAIEEGRMPVYMIDKDNILLHGVDDDIEFFKWFVAKHCSSDEWHHHTGINGTHKREQLYHYDIEQCCKEFKEVDIDILRAEYEQKK